MMMRAFLKRFLLKTDGSLTAASTFAGESPLGSANMEITLIMMVSTV